MSEIEGLLRAYEATVRLPWDPRLAGPQRVWFALYDPPQERRLRFRLSLFEVATKNAGHGWAHVDLTPTFAEWMAAHPYRDAYFQDPDTMDMALAEYTQYVAGILHEALTAPAVDATTVVAISGVATLLGLTRVSTVLEAAAPAVRGRLLVFFPGQHHGSNYRLLDARDGWNYLAIPISAAEGA